MSHTTRVERHIGVDLLASAAGGALVAAIIQKSWLCLVLALVSGATLYVFDRMSIEEDEGEEKPIERELPPVSYPLVKSYLQAYGGDSDKEEVPNKVTIPLSAYNRIRFESERDPGGIQSDEPLLIYHSGLQDGVITFAQWVREEMQIPDNGRETHA